MIGKTRNLRDLLLDLLDNKISEEEIIDYLLIQFSRGGWLVVIDDCLGLVGPLEHKYYRVDIFKAGTSDEEIHKYCATRKNTILITTNRKFLKKFNYQYNLILVPKKYKKMSILSSKNKPLADSIEHLLAYWKALFGKNKSYWIIKSNDTESTVKTQIKKCCQITINGVIFNFRIIIFSFGGDKMKFFKTRLFHLSIIIIMLLFLTSCIETNFYIKIYPIRVNFLK